MKRTLCAFAAALLLFAPASVCSAQDTADAGFGPALYWLPGQLRVYPEGYAAEAPVGSWTTFVVERDGAALSYHDVSYAVVSGGDCAAVYYDGSLLALGEGPVVVKAWLDDDPTVYGYGRIEVAAGGENKYTAVKTAGSLSAYDADFAATLADFPESYRTALLALHGKHPNWIFEPLYLGLDFWTSVDAEATGDRNLTLAANFSATLKSYAAGDYDRASGAFINKDTGWVSTNAIPVAYYMDPRNFLDERAVFQFESLGYDPQVHTLAGVESILAGSFMSGAQANYLDAAGNTVTSSVTYAQAILAAGAQTGVNPYYLAAKIRGEIGSSPSRSASGDCAGYEGLYNFYNIGATDGEGNIERALAWAAAGTTYNRPWTSPERSILGGAMYIAENYIATGQDSGYLQKWNVAPYTTSTVYLHQYMTNVSGALSQAMTAYSGYADIGMLESAVRFVIPVYDNMPAAAQRATGISPGFAQTATAAADVRVRTAPHAAGDPEGTTLRAGTAVRILRCVETDAAYFQSRLFYPYWYEIEFERDGTTHSGYVCENYLQPGAADVLAAGETRQLTWTLTPAASDDTVRWLSENEAVAAVTPAGLVTAVGPGRTTLLGYTSGGAFCEYAVLVK